VGVQGRRWRLPAKPAEVESRERFLAVLGLGEAAVTDVADAEERTSASAELYPAERAWLEGVCRAAGLTRAGAPSRLVRAIIRAVIAHREFLPFQVDLDTSELEWLKEVEVQPPEERLAAWLDALSRESLGQLSAAVQSAIARRDK
jgi:hypothetical protein